MCETTKKVYFTLTPEHWKILNQLSTKTKRDRKKLLSEAFDLALSKGLAPAHYRWNDKRHQSFDIDVPVDVVKKARELYEGKLTPLVVSGLLEIAKAEGMTVGQTQLNATADELQKLRVETSKISRDLSALTRKLTSDEVPLQATDSGAAARQVRSTLRKLLEQLEYFKKGSDSDRKKFREIVDPVEVGYITAMLRALFDDEAFQRWILATEFMGRRTDA